MEGYILGGRNIAESAFKDNFRKIHGRKELQNFERLFRANFIGEADFKNIAALGANAVRIPFNYRLIEKKAGFYPREGFSFLDKAFSWAEKYKLGIILDLHAAPGAQNCDWHADSKGRALLWESKNCQDRTFALWEKVADRYKDEPALIGYDVLNEPVLGNKSTRILKAFYRKLIRRIRSVDKKNIIFLEGDIWAQRIDFLPDLIADNIWISIHAYLPLNYVLNFTPFYKFPGKIDGVFWNKDTLCRHFRSYFNFSRKYKVKIFVGEFGINWRGGFWGELKWLEAVLSAFEAFGFSYTYWTYKAMAGHVFPDGLYQHIANSKYINREGPLQGYDTYIKFWAREKKAIADFWRTDKFSPNEELITTLGKYFKGKK